MSVPSKTTGRSKPARGFKAVLLGLAIVFAWACGVNSALHHWDDAIFGAVVVAVCLWIRTWDLKVAT